MLLSNESDAAMAAPADAGASRRSRSLSRRLRADAVAGTHLLREFAADERVLAECFIARRYAEVYGARVSHFLPRLFGLYTAQGELIAAFGLRDAGREPLFLERYLDAPIEAAVAQRAGHAVERSRIVEIGNLAGAHPGALRLLIPMLAPQLERLGYRWAACTGSAKLANGFSRLGLPVSSLAAASIERLPAQERADWGSYYASQPVVMLGRIAAAQYPATIAAGVLPEGSP